MVDRETVGSEERSGLRFIGRRTSYFFPSSQSAAFPRVLSSQPVFLIEDGGGGAVERGRAREDVVEEEEEGYEPDDDE